MKVPFKTIKNEWMEERVNRKRSAFKNHDEEWMEERVNRRWSAFKDHNRMNRGKSEWKTTKERIKAWVKMEVHSKPQ